jgi:hypothetical protein
VRQQGVGFWAHIEETPDPTQFKLILRVRGAHATTLRRLAIVPHDQVVCDPALPSLQGRPIDGAGRELACIRRDRTTQVTVAANADLQTQWATSQFLSAWRVVSAPTQESLAPRIPEILLGPCEIQAQGKVPFSGSIRRNGYAGRLKLDLWADGNYRSYATLVSESGDLLFDGRTIFLNNIGGVGRAALQNWRLVVTLSDHNAKLTRPLGDCFDAW